MKRIIAISVILISVLGLFNSCDKKDNPINKDYLTRYDWYEVYYEGDIEIEQVFTFNASGTGFETFTEYYSNGNFSKEGFPFEWEWIKGGTTIGLYYDDGTYMEFLVLELNKHKLTGYLEDGEVYFTPL